MMSVTDACRFDRAQWFIDICLKTRKGIAHAPFSASDNLGLDLLPSTGQRANADRRRIYSRVGERQRSQIGVKHSGRDDKMRK